MVKLPILVLLLLPLLVFQASAWSETNLQDFVGGVYNKTDCRNQTLNITEILLQENITEPAARTLNIYVGDGSCESFVRAAHDWFGLNYPSVTCPERFNDWVHTYFGEWNWKFADCGVIYTKQELSLLIDEYYQDFFTGELVFDEPTQADYTFNTTEQPQEPQQQREQWNPFGGGGISKNSIWDTWFFIPNWVIVEILLLLAAFLLGQKIWNHHAFKATDFKMDYNAGEVAVAMSTVHKLRVLLIIFVGVNIGWWAVFFKIL